MQISLQAAAVIKGALALARQYQQPRWEARALPDAGRIFDRLGRPMNAAGYFEGQVRIEVSAEIILGNMLAKSGEGERAGLVLEEA